MNKLKTILFYTLVLIPFSISAAFGQTGNVSAKNDSLYRVVNAPVDDFNKFRFGSYGEILFQHMNYGPNRYLDPNGSPASKRSYISLPRIVFAMDYKFRDDIILSSELEIEYGGTGAAMELEYAEAGEYEMEIEKGGEVMLEQLHITKRFNRAFSIRVGHMVVPIGLTNAHHEPIFFMTSSRPEGEVAMLPSTWHETGIALLGNIYDFGYNVMLVNGLDPNGFSTANWVGSGKQGIFETSVMTNPAVAGRLEYLGVKGLRLGASGYYAGRTAGNSSKPHFMTEVKGRVKIVSGDAQYTGHGVITRGNIIYGTLSDSREISKINTSFRKGGFPATPVAKAAMTYAAELGYDVFSLFRFNKKLVPFARYEYYNTAEDLEEGAAKQPRYKRDLVVFGLNYFPLPNLVVKLDYSHRRIDAGNYNNEDMIGIAVAYTGWFVNK